jgi:putative PIN family toxin of toxin-antitoxin system
MLKVVLDTVVFVRSLINPFGAAGRLVFDREGFRLFVSEPTVREVVEVLTRTELQRKYRSHTIRNAQAVLAILARAEVVVPASIEPTCRDPKDDIFLATAAAAQADYLVSEDRDLLVLREFQGTQIVTVGRFLYILDELEEQAERE